MPENRFHEAQQGNNLTKMDKKAEPKKMMQMVSKNMERYLMFLVLRDLHLKQQGVTTCQLEWLKSKK